MQYEPCSMTLPMSCIEPGPLPAPPRRPGRARASQIQPRSRARSGTFSSQAPCQVAPAPTDYRQALHQTHRRRRQRVRARRQITERAVHMRCSAAGLRTELGGAEICPHAHERPTYRSVHRWERYVPTRTNNRPIDRCTDGKCALHAHALTRAL